MRAEEARKWLDKGHVLRSKVRFLQYDDEIALKRNQEMTLSFRSTKTPGLLWDNSPLGPAVKDRRPSWSTSTTDTNTLDCDHRAHLADFSSVSLTLQSS